MAAMKILSVGFEIPGSQAEFCRIHEKKSLLDYDIAIFDPNFTWMYSYDYPNQYQGEPCLDDTSSVRYSEQVRHWNREILEAAKAGKTVFILARPEERVYVHTGDISYQGTGRNARRIRGVNIKNNYEIVPGGVTVTNTKGKSMKLSGNGNFLSQYWSTFESSSEYQVILNGEGLRPLIETKDGKKTVGAYLKYKEASGALIILPYIDFENNEFYEEKDGEFYFNKKATKFGASFTASICEVVKAFKTSNKFSPAPEWVKNDKYKSKKEHEIQDAVLRIEAKLSKLTEDKQKQQKLLDNEQSLKGLLYETGKPLETSIIIALKILGFTAAPFQNADSEFDIVFSCPEGRMIGEAEGKDTKPINIDKFRQLSLNLHEDFQREEVTEMAKGVLFGNAFRLSPVEKREDYFTAKCLSAAQSNNSALVKTTDLFLVAKYISDHEDKDFANLCRNSILSTTGLVIFPDRPSSHAEEKKEETKTA